MRINTGLLELTSAEKKLIAAAAVDAEAELLPRRNGQRPVIRAEVLRDLCTGARKDWPVKDRIRMADGRVRGPLDLSGADLMHALHFTRCVFEEVDLTRARADKPVEWNGGRIGSILADHFSSASDLVIQNATVAGLVSLRSAWVRGDVRLSDSLLSPQSGQAICAGAAEGDADAPAVDADAPAVDVDAPAVDVDAYVQAQHAPAVDVDAYVQAQRDRLRVDGTLFLNGGDFHARGEVCLRGARISGQLNCRRARFTNPAGHSISAGQIVVGGHVLLDQGFRADGEVCLQEASVGQLRATGGSFASATTYALHADALHAQHGVYLDRGFRATATVRLAGANITGELACTRGSFHDPSGRALDAERIAAEDVYLDHGFTARGEVRFNDAKVSRQFNATNGDFRNDHSGGHALSCDGLSCDGDVFLSGGFRAVGTVSLADAEIAHGLNCTDGSFTTPGGCALVADGMTTPGRVWLDRGFRAMGEVRLARATIGRQLVCTDGVFDNQHGTALDLTGLKSNGDVLLSRDFRATGEIRIRKAVIANDVDFTGAQLHGSRGVDASQIQIGGSLRWIMDRPPEGLVDFSFAQIDQLDGSANSWGVYNYTLTAMVYHLATTDRLTEDQRVEWLSKAKKYPGDAVYEQLAQAYRLSASDLAARRIAIAGQRDLRKRGGLSRTSKAWNWFLDVSVGYGYRLHRPFLVLLVLGLISYGLYRWGEAAHLIYSTQAEHVVVAPGCPSGYPCFAPSTYSLQLLIPAINLREAAYWFPNATIRPWGTLLAIYTGAMIIIGWGVVLALIPGISRYFRGR